jgi:pimeloyl-ACP methyl ester carboxylesterase
MRRTRRLLASCLVLVFVTLVAAPGAEARSDDRAKPVVYVHGYDVFGKGTDCSMWNDMANTLQSWGHTGQQVLVKYYSVDAHCTHQVQDHGNSCVHFGPCTDNITSSTRIEHIAYRLAWLIYDDHTSQGRAVDVVAHSMGGLVTRYMIAQVQRGHPDFPPSLLVEDVVTYGSPHAGTGWAYWCWTTQCSQMRPGSSFISWLGTHAPNPQATGGTDWTVFGSDSDGIVSSSSAVAMSAAHKVIYLSHTGYGHSDFYRDTSDARDAHVHYQDDGGPWYAWYSAPRAVRWADFALVSGSW